MNVMKLLGMIEGKSMLKKQNLNPKVERVISEHGGLWLQRVRVGEKVKKGDVLGEVWNLLGDTIQRIEAPCKGVISSSRPSIAVNEGDVLLQVSEV